MASKEKWNVDGLQELSAVLKKLPENIEKNALRSMVRAGGQVVRKDALKKEGLPKDALIVRASRRRSKNGKQVVTVSVSGEFFYLMFKEIGTLPHIIEIRKKKVLAGPQEVYGLIVQHPGQAPEPFLGPALNENLNTIINAMAKQGFQYLNKKYGAKK